MQVVSIAKQRASSNGARNDTNGSAQPSRAPAFERGDHVELGLALLDALPSDAPIVADYGALHTYSQSRGIWSKVERGAASRTVQAFAGASVGVEKPKSLRLRASDVHGAMELAEDQASRPGFFDDATPGLAFDNGFVRLEGKAIRFVAHSPEHAARYAYPFEYASGAECPRWIECLRAAWRDDADVDAKIACLQEFAGASLLGLATKYQRAIVLYGVGANAKSTIAKVIEAAFPPGSTSAVAPQSWGNEYRLAHLAGKLLNVVNELPETDILAGETFKTVVTGEKTTAREIRQAPFDLCARAGQLFAANRLPSTTDHSHGFWRRPLVLTFSRDFALSEQNANIADEIIAAELAGIVAWMLAGAQRVIEQGRYTEPASSVAAVSDWKRGADPIALFVEERTRKARTDAERTPAKALFTAYVEWAEANRFKVMSVTSFGLRMRAIGLPSEHTRDGKTYSVTLLRAGEQPDPADEKYQDEEREGIRGEGGTS